MKRTKQLSLVLMTTLVISNMASAKNYQAEKDKNVAIGMGSGLVIGALVAGPIGAGVAGIFGALIGDHKSTSEELKDKERDLLAAKHALNTTQQKLFATRDEMRALKENVTMTPVSLTAYPEEQVMAMESHVQFKTGSDEVESVYDAQLNLLANALKQHRDLTVRLIGHADNRGDTTFNQSLSEKRARAVKETLLRRGVESAQIETVAMGESASLHDDMENAFFDRKVVVQVMPGSPSATAKR
ncbi:sortase-associated OmpA-like protein PdsO [Aestuariibacter sp. A3R04]|uniref:sortase-associated OmpA-like protein PdsO n=1 Tax=Aestuariibacter sp. A3R04 TaxID=2841571 RepID=UPI001C08FA3D|nr:sortase-associated OmpA-like protein PdsO [Aestuariibacter sp. A3R04]MBU3023912.1 sortase-associated OmpA-like protein PdsO [Aestuariibacter sp. A3R04]